MADEKDKSTKVVTNTFVEHDAPQSAKTYNYVGPKPAPLISNLPHSLGQPRLGSLPQKYPADQLFDALGAAYVEYVMKTNTEAKNWWK